MESIGTMKNIDVRKILSKLEQTHNNIYKFLEENNLLEIKTKFAEEVVVMMSKTKKSSNIKKNLCEHTWILVFKIRKYKRV